MTEKITSFGSPGPSLALHANAYLFFRPSIIIASPHISGETLLVYMQIPTEKYTIKNKDITLFSDVYI